jgi:hypothetical protein
MAFTGSAKASSFRRLGFPASRCPLQHEALPFQGYVSLRAIATRLRGYEKSAICLGASCSKSIGSELLGSTHYGMGVSPML